MRFWAVLNKASHEISGGPPDCASVVGSAAFARCASGIKHGEVHEGIFCVDGLSPVSRIFDYRSRTTRRSLHRDRAQEL